MQNRIADFFDSRTANQPIAEMTPSEKAQAAQAMQQAAEILSLRRQNQQLQRWMFSNQN